MLRENGVQLRSMRLSRACLGECVRLILGRMLGQREPRPTAAASASPHKNGEPAANTGDSSAAQPPASDSHSSVATDPHDDDDDGEFEHYFASRDERKFVCAIPLALYSTVYVYLFSG